jgi:adenylate cyclase class IV
MKNIEIKVRVGEKGGGLLGLARKACAMGARRVSVLHQTDTYFRLSEGRLKLRETRGAKHAELIFYARQNKTGSK